LSHPVQKSTQNVSKTICNPVTLKLLEENLGETLQDIGNEFLNRTPIAQGIKARTDNEIASNSKAFGQQRKQLTVKR
jgi:hypothetical protein